MAKKTELGLKRQHRDVTVKLAKLNREMAMQLIGLASETGETQHLIDAVKALRAADELYSEGTTPVEGADLKKKLGDTLLKIGKDEEHMAALDHAIIAYRGAITIYSMLGEEKKRAAARKNYALARNLRGLDDGKPSMSLMGAA